MSNFKVRAKREGMTTEIMMFCIREAEGEEKKIYQIQSHKPYIIVIFLILRFTLSVFNLSYTRFLFKAVIYIDR